LTSNRKSGKAMPLFDPNIIPAECGTPEYITAVNVFIDRFRERRVPFLPLAGAVRTANLVRCYIQAHIRRCIEFLEAGHAEFYAGRSLVTYVCARSNLENIAAFCDFAGSLIPLLEAGDHDTILKFIDARAFWTKIPSFIQEYGETLSARSILTQVDKMNKKYPQFRQAYDHLSDFVHPNALGAVVHFTSIDDGIAAFHDLGKAQHHPLGELIASGFLLGYMEIAIGEIELRLTAFDA
jgi:hypothetical protein